MHTESIERWVHDHTFGQDEKKSAERRTLIVFALGTKAVFLVLATAGMATLWLVPWSVAGPSSARPVPARVR